MVNVDLTLGFGGTVGGRFLRVQGWIVDIVGLISFELRFLNSVDQVYCLFDSDSVWDKNQLIN